jgi:hypothetical protein
MNYAIALLAVLSLAGHAFADEGCPLSRSLTIRFAELFGDLAVAASHTGSVSNALRMTRC